MDDAILIVWSENPLQSRNDWTSSSDNIASWNRVNFGGGSSRSNCPSSSSGSSWTSESETACEEPRLAKKWSSQLLLYCMQVGTSPSPSMYSSTGQFVSGGEIRSKSSCNTSWASTSSKGSSSSYNRWTTEKPDPVIPDFVKHFLIVSSWTEFQASATHLMAISTLIDLTICETVSLVSSIFERTNRRRSFL